MLEVRPWDIQRLQRKSIKAGEEIEMNNRDLLARKKDQVAGLIEQLF